MKKMQLFATSVVDLNNENNGANKFLDAFREASPEANIFLLPSGKGKTETAIGQTVIEFRKLDGKRLSELNKEEFSLFQNTLNRNRQFGLNIYIEELDDKDSIIHISKVDT